MTANSYTNSLLKTHRECPYKAHLKYDQLLGLLGQSSEALAVGSCWAKAHDADRKNPTGELHTAAYVEIDHFAPSPLWREKLRRMYAAYHWYWKDDPLETVESELTFSATLQLKGGSVLIEGQLDAKVRNFSGAVGVLEQKTTADSIDTGALYWDRLRLDPQTGTYALALDPLPAFIIYDVAKKPGMNPKKLSAKDVKRLRTECGLTGFGKYFDVDLSEEQLEMPLLQSFESLEMYGARLTSDIGDRPGWYFARREVVRTKQDYESILGNIKAQIEVIEHEHERGVFFKNPDACANFGRCEYFSLCSNNVEPIAGEIPPAGFTVREHRHPELHDPEPKTEE